MNSEPFSASSATDSSVNSGTTTLNGITFPLLMVIVNVNNGVVKVKIKMNLVFIRSILYYMFYKHFHVCPLFCRMWYGTIRVVGVGEVSALATRTP